MLAVKLHKAKRPWLGRGCYLVPILDWTSGSLQVKNWIRLLEVPRRRNHPNTTIRYLTLCRIPTDHPVALYDDWVAKFFLGVQFQPLSAVDQKVKQTIRQFLESMAATQEFGGPRCTQPELILGVPLPRGSVLWTKRIQELMWSSSRRDRKSRQRRLERIERKPRLNPATARYDHTRGFKLDVE